MRQVHHYWGTAGIGYPKIPISRVRRPVPRGIGDNQREDPLCLGAGESGTTKRTFEIWCVRREPRVCFRISPTTERAPTATTDSFFRKIGDVRRNGDVYRATRRSTSGTCAASTKNVAPSRSASRRAHRSASSWYRSGHIPSRYICHLRDQSALHSSGSTSTIVRIMSPSSSAPQPPLPTRATQGAPVSPRRAQESTEVGSTSVWWRRKPVGGEYENGAGAAFTRVI